PTDGTTVNRHRNRSRNRPVFRTVIPGAGAPGKFHHTAATARFECVRMTNLPSSVPRKSPTTRRGVRVLAAVAACSTALFLAACAEDAPEEPTTEVEQAVGLAVDAPRITLQDAGTGELREIRYADVPDPDASDSPTRQATTLTVEDGFAQSVVPATEVDPTAPEGGDVSTMRLPVTAEVTPAEPVDADVVDPSREISIQVGRPAFTDVELAEDILSTE